MFGKSQIYLKTFKRVQNKPFEGELWQDLKSDSFSFEMHPVSNEILQFCWKRCLMYTYHIKKIQTFSWKNRDCWRFLHEKTISTNRGLDIHLLRFLKNIFFCGSLWSEGVCFLRILKKWARVFSNHWLHIPTEYVQKVSTKYM
jgi:hypothetical protein